MAHHEGAFQWHVSNTANLQQHVSNFLFDSLLVVTTFSVTCPWLFVEDISVEMSIHCSLMDGHSVMVT